MRFYADKKKNLDKLFEKVESRYFSDNPIRLAKIMYCFWEGDQKQADGRLKIGEARILSLRERDLYGYDFLISVDADIWKGLSLTDKIRLAVHELNHCIVVAAIVKEEWIPKEDSEGRIKIKLKKHDVNVNVFRYEIETCGLYDGERKTLTNTLEWDRQALVRDKASKKKKKQ